VFFHGNADQIGWGAARLARKLADAYNIGLFAIEYPGYGKAQGSPSEETIYESSNALLDHLTSPEGLGVPQESITLLGQSIGCAVALEMASRGFAKRLMLLSPFTSIPEMAVEAYPIFAPVVKIAPFLVLDKFDNMSKAKDLPKRCSTLVVHGTDDEIVPYSQGAQLKENISGSVMVPVRGGGHNDLLFGVHEEFVMKLIAEHAHKEV